MPQARRGEVWYADLDPVVGHEQGRRRPVLVISVDTFNHSRLDMLITAPLTSQPKRIPTHVPMVPPEGGLTVPSWIRCEDIRAISKDRLGRFVGAVSPATMLQVEDRLRRLLGL
jgi:mRNA interferase MazF